MKSIIEVKNEETILTNNSKNTLKSNKSKASASTYKSKQDNCIFVNKVIICIFGIYYGISFFFDLPTMYFVKDVLESPPGSYSQISAITLIPWSFKPVFGFISDYFPIFGYKRKSYLILNSLILIFTWLMFILHNNSILESIILLLIINICLCFTCVVCDAVVVETTKEMISNSLGIDSESKDKEEFEIETKKIISMYVLMKNIGFIINSFMKTFFIEYFDQRKVFYLCAGFPVIILVCSFFMYEKFELIAIKKSRRKTLNSGTASKNVLINIKENVSNDKIDNTVCKEKNVKSNDEEFWSFICRKEIIIPLSFIIYYCSMPGFDDPMFYFMTTKLKFSAKTLGLIYFFSNVFSLLAIFLYQVFLMRRSYSFIIVTTSTISFVFTYLSYMVVTRENLKWGISDIYCCLFSSSFNVLLAEIVSLPLYSLACILCPPNLEASVYSIFASACNFGTLISNIETSYLTNYYGITNDNFEYLPNLITLSNIFSLTPILFILLIDNKYFEPPSKESIENNIMMIEKYENIDEVNKDSIDKNENQNVDNKLLNT